MLFLWCVILAVLVFTYTNGFHDTANSIATVVSTKVLTPRQAILMATVFNLMGALAGTAVASTVGKGMVDPEHVTMMTVFCAMLSAISWNLLTWYFGINIGVAAPMAFFPFSGARESFFGDLHGQGRHAIEFFTQTKVVIERWPKQWARKF